jgi:hypothetical protein
MCRLSGDGNSDRPPWGQSSVATTVAAVRMTVANAAEQKGAARRSMPMIVPQSAGGIDRRNKRLFRCSMSE